MNDNVKFNKELAKIIDGAVESITHQAIMNNINNVDEFDTLLNLVSSEETRILGYALIQYTRKHHDTDFIHQALKDLDIVKSFTEKLYLLGGRILSNDELMDIIMTNIFKMYMLYISPTFQEGIQHKVPIDIIAGRCIISAFEEYTGYDTKISMDSLIRNLYHGCGIGYVTYIIDNSNFGNITMSWDDAKVIMVVFLEMNGYPLFLPLSSLFDLLQQDNYNCNINWMSQILDMLCRGSKKEHDTSLRSIPSMMLLQISEYENDFLKYHTHNIPSMLECVKYIIDTYNSNIGTSVINDNAQYIQDTYRLLIDTLTNHHIISSHGRIYMFDIKIDLSKDDGVLNMLTEMYCNLCANNNEVHHGYDTFVTMIHNLIDTLTYLCVRSTTLILSLYNIVDDGNNIFHTVVAPEYEQRQAIKKFRKDVIENKSADILNRFLESDIVSLDQLIKEFGITRELLAECVNHCKTLYPDLVTRFRRKTCKLRQYTSDHSGIRQELRNIAFEFNKLQNPTLLDFCKITKYPTRFIKNVMNDPETPYSTWGNTPEEALRFCEWINRHVYQDEESIPEVTDIVNNGHLIYGMENGEYRELSTTEKLAVMQYMRNHILPLSPALFVQVCREYVKGNININR